MTGAASSFVYPTIIALPLGYDCTTQLAHRRVAQPQQRGDLPPPLLPHLPVLVR